MSDEKLGPTGDFPRGHMNEHDEGAINLGLVANKGKVVMAFGKPIYWIGFDPADARTVAKALEEKALEAEAQLQQPKVPTHG